MADDTSKEYSAAELRENLKLLPPLVKVVRIVVEQAGQAGLPELGKALSDLDQTIAPPIYGNWTFAFRPARQDNPQPYPVIMFWHEDVWEDGGARNYEEYYGPIKHVINGLQLEEIDDDLFQDKHRTKEGLQARLEWYGLATSGKIQKEFNDWFH